MSYTSGYSSAKANLKTAFIPTKDCQKAKENIEQLKLLITDFSVKAISDSTMAGYTKAYKDRLSECEAYYNFGDCENYFNKKKVDFLGNVIATESKEYEQIVSAQTVAQNKIVLFVGASIMLVGMFIIIKKK